jgi:hypothetical protein
LPHHVQQCNDDQTGRSADTDYLPASSSSSTNHGPPHSSLPASSAETPQPRPHPNDEPTLRRGSRVRFNPVPLVVGDPNHPYWRAHHLRPRIPTPGGEGR